MNQPSNQATDAPDCGVEVVGRGEGSTLATIYKAAAESKAHGAFNVAYHVGCLCQERGSEARTNIKITGPITAEGLRLIAERLEV